MKKLTTMQITVLAFCLTLGLAAKRVISPVTNVLTDFFRIPGGSAAAGFSLAFLTLGCGCVPVFGVGTLMGFTQGLLAMILGISGYQGAMCFITYTIPGLVMDVTGRIFPAKSLTYFILTCGTANGVSAWCSNLLVFHLSGPAFLLWMLLGVCSGSLGGWMASDVYEKLSVVQRRERQVL